MNECKLGHVTNTISFSRANNDKIYQFTKRTKRSTMFKWTYSKSMNRLSKVILSLTILGIFVVLYNSTVTVGKDQEVRYNNGPDEVDDDEDDDDDVEEQERDQFDSKFKFRGPVMSEPIKWPPNNPQDLLNPQTGLYNLTLPVRIRKESEPVKSTDWIQDYVRYLSDHFQGHKFQGSPLKQLVQMDQQMRLGAGQPNYLLYPSAIDVRLVVEAIKRGKPINAVPVNNPELMAIQVPRDVCSTNPGRPVSSHDLVILVKSCVFCFKERHRARQTFMKPQLWINFSVGFVFVTGQPQVADFASLFLRPEQNHPSLDENLTEFIRGLKLESDTFGDLLIGSFDDTYFNLTYKQMFSFRWVSTFCRRSTRMALFLDHDRVVIPPNLIKFIRKIPQDLQSELVGGLRYHKLNVIRERLGEKPARVYHKWAVSEDEIPWVRYPPFVAGPSYLVGLKVIDDVAIASAFVRYFRLEDVYLGIILRKLNRFSVGFEEFLGNKFTPDSAKKSVCLYRVHANQVYNWNTGEFQ